MSKYISTLVNNKPTCLSLMSCNLCPYLNINSLKKEAICLNNNNKLIEKIYYYTYDRGYHRPLKKISIPNWCLLDDDFYKPLLQKDVIVYKYGEINKIKYEILNKDILNDNYVKYIENKLVTKEKFDNVINENNIQSFEKICSNCGKYKEDVNRNENIGMCSDCYSNFKISNDNYNIYINNFRLKRNIPHINKIPKSIF